MAEAYLNHLGAGFRAYSAGSDPTGRPNPLALATLEAEGIAPVAGDGAPPRSKSWDEFASDDSPVMDVVLTVCDNAAGEVCPIWPTRGGPAPKKLHWSFPDPAAATGTEAERRAVFAAIFADIRDRIDRFVAEEG
jgi:arsenate reductase